MTEAQNKVINELRESGYAIAIWSPEEVQGVSNKDLESQVAQFGNEVIFIQSEIEED
jgi:hypothetical protein